MWSNAFLMRRPGSWCAERILSFGFICFIFLAMPLTGFAASYDRIVAKVNDEIITISGLGERMKAEVARYRQAGALESLPPKEQFMQMILDKMIDEKLQIQDGKTLGVSVDEENVLKALDDIKKANNINDDQLGELLKSESTSLDEYKDTIRRQIMVSKVIGFQVNNRTKVSEKDAQKYYRKHRKEYLQQGKVHARHILFIIDDALTPEQIAVKEKTAKEVKARLNKGENFEKLAKQYSEDISASNGGDLGWLERGKMVIELENAIFSLKVGETSDLIRTPYGLHIVKVEKVKSGGPRPFKEVQEEITNKLRAEKYQKNYESYMNDLRQAAFIEKSLNGKPAKQKRVRKNTSRSAKLSNKKKLKRSGRKTARRSQPKTKRKVDPNDILPPLSVSKPKKSATPQLEVAERIKTPSSEAKTRVPSFKNVQQALKKIKKMRDEKVISEAEYQEKKKALLSKL